MGKRRGNRRSAKPARRSSAADPLVGWPETLGEVVLLALVLAVPVALNPYSRNICDVKDGLQGLGVALGLALWLLAGLARGRLAWAPSRLTALALAFAAWTAVSIAYSGYRYVAVSEFGRLCAQLGLFLLVVVSLRTPAQIRRLGIAAGVASTAVAIYAYFQKAGRDLIAWSEPTTRVFSFLGNPTFLGGFVVLVAPLLVAVGWSWLVASPGARPRLWPWLPAGALFLVAGMLLLALYFSVTLAGAIGLVLALPVLAAVGLARVWREAAPKALAALGLALVVLAPLAYLGYRHLPPGQQRRVQMVVRLQDPYGAERRLHWKVALDIFREQPIIGKGYGGFRVYSLERMAPDWYEQTTRRAEKMLLPGYAHNEYLQVLADLGVVGAALFLPLVVGAYGLAARTAARHPLASWAALGFGAVAAFTAFLFQNLFGVTFRQTGAVTFFWLWLGLVVVASAWQEGDQGPPRLREWRPRALGAPALVGLGAALAALLAVLALVVIRPIQATMVLVEAQKLALAGDFRGAAAAAQRTTQLCPYSLVGHYVAGYAWGKLGEYARAAEANQRALELMPGNASVYYNLGVSYKELNQLDRAAESFQRAVELMPTNSRHHAALAETRLAQGELERAERAAREAVRVEPDNANLRLLLIEILVKEGRRREAADELDQAVKLAPADERLKRQLAQILFELAEWERAAALARGWLRTHPGSADPYNVLGTYYFRRGQYAEARQQFERAVELSPRYWRAHLNLGYTLGRLGDRDAALARVRHVATQAPDTPEGREARRFLEMSAGASR